MNCKKLISCVELSKSNPQEIVKSYFNKGTDAILLWDDKTPSSSQEEHLITMISQLAAAYDLPLMVYQTYPRFEDIKKIIYAGASLVVMNPFEGGGKETLKEGVARFGDENVIGTLVGVPDHFELSINLMNDLVENTKCHVWMMTLEQMNHLQNWIKEQGIQVILWTSFNNNEYLESLMNNPLVKDVCLIDAEPIDLYNVKCILKEKGIPVSLLESSLPFSQFKCNSDGLIPVITQDYKTGKVLMLAYMNEASYNETIRSGQMTYYSRSRKCLWKKGETSGHYQYVKSLDIDCDKDTILAKVHQIGVACHTGSESCFFTNLVNTRYDETNPQTILGEIMTTVQDRKVNPKEGSYTNYLFEKGIDKILKKVGEEAAEIIIAAKNPDTSELKYEISDFLYHMIVLMVEKGVTWEEVSSELAKRH